MKSIAKILLVGAVAVMAIAVSAAPSEAAKKKRMKAPAKGTYVGQVCSTGGKVMVWGAHEVVAGDFHAGLRRAVLPSGLLNRFDPSTLSLSENRAFPR